MAKKPVRTATSLNQDRMAKAVALGKVAKAQKRAGKPSGNSAIKAGKLLQETAKLRKKIR
jgi:hypothetical protein